MRREIVRGLAAAAVLLAGAARGDVPRADVPASGCGGSSPRSDPPCTVASEAAPPKQCELCAGTDAQVTPCALDLRERGYAIACVDQRSGTSVLCTEPCPTSLPTACSPSATCPADDPTCGEALLDQGYVGFCQRDGTAGSEAVFCQWTSQARRQAPQRGGALPAAGLMLAASAVACVALRRRRS